MQRLLGLNQVREPAVHPLYLQVGDDLPGGGLHVTLDSFAPIFQTFGGRFAFVPAELAKMIPICDQELSGFTSGNLEARLEHVMIASKIHCSVTPLGSLNVLHERQIGGGVPARRVTDAGWKRFVRNKREVHFVGSLPQIPALARVVDIPP